jgi:hypothetical protein
MSRKYRTIVSGATMPNLEWGAKDESDASVAWASGTITLLDATGKTTVLTDDATVSVDTFTLSWTPSGIPDADVTKVYKVRWRGVTPGGAVWYSRPLIEITVEPLP